IEDHRPLARALRQALEEEGHTVEVAWDTDTGDRKARTAEYGVIILDLVRHREDGLTLLRRWRQAGLRTSVLALIAPGKSEEDTGARDPEADDYLTVPFPLQAFLTRLQALAHAGPRGACQCKQ